MLGMKYAVVKLQGHQYKVEEGQDLLVDLISTDGKTIKVKPLLLVDGETIEIGKPTLDKHEVSFEIKNEEKGEKIHIRTFKAKSRFRKHKGFRAKYTRLTVTSIA